MKKILIISLIAIATSAFSIKTAYSPYRQLYLSSIKAFEDQQLVLLDKINKSPLSTAQQVAEIKEEIERARLKLKVTDLWLRYLEPVAYKKINGPLPVEWENEVFEKFEKPYKREGAGLALAELYLNEKDFKKDSVIRLIRLSAEAINTYRQDSITGQLETFDHFFFCNRLYLLNLAAIYTTGFECPGNNNIIPELKYMVAGVKDIYTAYNQSFALTPLTKEYLDLYDKTIDFVSKQPNDFERFDHFSFIKDYVNPLFALNQKLIRSYNARSISFNDYTLNNASNSIFDKSLYTPQNSKGIYSMVDDTEALNEIKAVGKLLFYDPILSGNNSRSCASCHKPKQYFTDTSVATALQFDQKQRLPRNTPSLIDVVYNHLLMLDGRHISLQNQGKDVTTNPVEMGGKENELMEKVLSCKEYRTSFKKFLKLTPEESKITFNHIVSAITFYYSDFSNYYSPFDETMNNNKPIDTMASKGFNLFMSKAQCGTCHYVPQFNGVPPPYIGSEFEVIGVPADKSYNSMSHDSGRYKVIAAYETMNAFRTGTIRNAEFTKPYMHNGIFNTLDEVVDFYDGGGGAGRKLNFENQTLSADSLRLTVTEKKELISFIHSLNEKVIFQDPPKELPLSSDKELNNRVVGGTY